MRCVPRAVFACIAVVVSAGALACGSGPGARVFPAHFEGFAAQGGSGARIAGGVNVEPSMRPWRYLGANPDSWWCAPPNCVQNPNPSTSINAELALAQQLGVANVRLELPWYLVEPQRGQFDWTRADLIFAAAAAHAVQLQPILLWTPPWAASSPDTAPAAADFSAFVTSFMQRYHGSISVVEMWNEPDGGSYWNSGQAAYVQDVLIPGYRAVKAVDPLVQVALGGNANDAGSCCPWFNGIYANGGGLSFDIATFHNYVGSVAQEASAYAAVLSANGQSSKPIWVGEYGVQENSIHDVNQQQLMTSVLTGSAPIAMAQWYNLRDDDAVNCCPDQIAKSAYWGLVQHDDVTNKDGFATMRSLLGGGSGQGGPPPPTPTAKPLLPPISLPPLPRLPLAGPKPRG